MRAQPACWKVAFALVALLALPLRAEFAVNPIRLDLGPAARNGAIAVRNEGKEPLGFQMQAMEWTQDAQGKDTYTETADLIFFPKIMTVEPGKETLLRVGVKNAVVPTEKTYRLFIEQMPGARTESTPGAAVNVLIRFGAPIFVSPAAPRDGAEFTAASLAKGVLTLGVRNTGNRHQVVQGIELKGQDTQGNEVYSLMLADRYILAGTTKTYTATIPAAQCGRIAGLTVELKTDKLALKNKLDVNRAMCP
jgi:fimbrial chaperone protein